MKKLMFFFCFALTSMSNAQPLSFSEIGGNEAYCRAYGYQSGNGVIWALATGGTSPYTYLMTNLSTGATTTNTTWGGINAGQYEIKAWDAAGDSIVEVMFLDSINPAASFNVISSGLTPQGNDLYWGEAGVEVDFQCTSTGVYNFNNPNSDTSVYWQMTQFENWYSTLVFQTESYTYNYGGTWAMSLVAINDNGCTDTAKAYIWLNGAAAVVEDDKTAYKLWFDGEAIQLVLPAKANHTIQIFNLSGKLVEKQTLNTSNYPVSKNLPAGVYIVQIALNNEAVFTDKIVLEK